MGACMIGNRSVGFSPDLGADLVRLVRVGLGRSEAAEIVGMGERTLFTWQALGRRGHPGFRPWVEAIDEAARIARRDRNRGGPKALEALTRGLLKITLRWRWVVCPWVLEIVSRLAGWINREAPVDPTPHGLTLGVHVPLF